MIIRTFIDGDREKCEIDGKPATRAEVEELTKADMQEVECKAVGCKGCNSKHVINVNGVLVSWNPRKS
jgi:hypothetical protein